MAKWIGFGLRLMLVSWIIVLSMKLVKDARISC
jgi:hypothetical protein